MGGHVSDNIDHTISLCKFENKEYKRKALHEIKRAICSMLNSNGGKVVLRSEADNDVPAEGSPFSWISLVIRTLEQSLISTIGSNQTVFKIDFEEDYKESLVIMVEKADYLITTNYNLYLPSQSQVILVSPCEPLEKVKNDIINRKFVSKPVQPTSQKFHKGETFRFHESKTCQFKNLKAGPSKHTRLADRMTGKFSFANYNGGHMYYGIRDDGVVEGEWIPNEDISEIRNKVEKAVNKMIWPQQIGQPKRGKHWNILFEPVLDENSKPIPSTYVIVVYIAPCLGGVFTEEPECYEMVQGKSEKLS